MYPDQTSYLPGPGVAQSGLELTRRVLDLRTICRAMNT